MTKQTGLGDYFLANGYEISNDIAALNTIAANLATTGSTGIDKFANERLPGQYDGEMSWTSYFNPSANRSHAVLSTLPSTDNHIMYLRGTTLGNAAACMVAKRTKYDGKRNQDGSFTFSGQALANAYGLAWGNQLTAGVRTDTTATNGTGVDTVSSQAHGGQAYLQVTAFTGTGVTIKIQDSADNVSFADVTGLSFTTVTSAPTYQRLALADGTTIRRYVRAVTVSAGGFTSVSFVVVFSKNFATVNL